MAMTTSAQQILSDGRIGGQTQIPEQYWELVERYREELIQQAQIILKSREDAEDVAQETFWQAYRSNQKITEATSIGAWLRSVNRNKALNRLRGNRRSNQKVAVKKRCLDEKNFTTGGFSALEQGEAVNKVLETLPMDLRTIVELRYWQQLSYKEIAQRLQLRIDMVHRRLAEALSIMYSRLESHQKNPQSLEHRNT